MLPSIIDYSLETYHVPKLVTQSGGQAREKFLEFFLATIRNTNTRQAYACAVAQCLAFLETHGITTMKQITPLMIAAYIEQHQAAIPTVKQHLAAIRMLFDFLVAQQVLPSNPAITVKAPRHSIKIGKTPVLSAEETRTLLDSININTWTGLRDRALISTMVYSFARISAVIHLRVEDYYTQQRRAWFRFQEKGGKEHCVPAHHNAEHYIDAYLEKSEHREQKKAWLFCTKNQAQFTRDQCLRMIKRRARKAGLPDTIGCHTFRATGITTFLQNDGALEKAQQIAGHASMQTTKLYDRRHQDINLDEIERIRI